MASKIYILVKDTVDLGHAILGAAHASLSGYLTFQDQPRMQEWATKSFRKVVCKVSDAEFEKAKTYGEPNVDYRVMVESGLDNMEVAIVFCPKEDWPPFFKSLKLYK